MGFLEFWSALIGRPGARRAPIRKREARRPWVEALEDRIVPATVTIAALQIGSEGSANAIARVFRTDATGSLEVTYSLDVANSTAISGTDFSTLSGILTIPDGESYADINVVTITDSVLEVPKTVTLNLEAASGGGVSHTIGAADSATLTIHDDFDVYLAAVAAADEAYAEALEEGVVLRDQAIADARAGAQIETDALYLDYEDAIDDIDQDYTATVAGLEAAYTSAVASADTTLQADYAAALATYDDTVALLRSDQEATLEAAEQTYEAALNASDATHAAAIEPYQILRDQAHANYLVDPDDPDLQAALDDAEAALSAAIDQADSDRDLANAQALESLQTAIDSATESLADADSAALVVCQASEEAAEQAWTDATDYARTLYLGDKAAADLAAEDARNNAWSAHLVAVAAVASELALTESTAQAQLLTSVAVASTAWQTSEQDACDAFHTATGALLGALALGERRILEPTAVEVPPADEFPGLDAGAQHEFVAAGVAPAVIGGGIVAGAALVIWGVASVATTYVEWPANHGQRNRVLTEVLDTDPVGNIRARRTNIPYPEANPRDLFNQLIGGADGREERILAGRDVQSATFTWAVRLNYSISGATLARRSGHVNFRLEFLCTANIQLRGANGAITETHGISSVVGTVQDDRLRDANNIIGP